MIDRVAVLEASPLIPGVAPVPIRYRTAGSGPALLILHGGWGYEVYPFDRQIAALSADYRVVVPDRSGYGQSGTLTIQHPDFHQRAAEETRSVVDALAIDRVVLWGHSDGAVIALLLGLIAPRRVSGIVAEATHFFRRKPGSRGFFETMRDAPERLGDRVVAALQRDHGDRWKALIQANGAAWLRIGDEARSDMADLYDGRLNQLRVPTLLLHGARDPRTEPGELDALRTALAAGAYAEALLEEGGHSPHSERAAADAATAAAVRFIAECRRP